MALFRNEERKIGTIFDDPIQKEVLPEDTGGNQFTKGVSAGIDQTMGLGGALQAMAGSVIGNDEWVQEGMDYYRQKMREAEQVGAKTTQVEDIENLGDFFNYAGYTLGTLVPDVLGGGVGGIAAKFAAKKALKGVVEEGAETVSGRLAERALRKNYDALAGAGAYSTAANTAENFADIYEETGIEAPGKALAIGVAQGALDTFGVPMRAARRLFPEKMDDMRDGIAEKLLDERGYLRRVISEATKTAGTEGATEAMQEVLGRAAVGWAQESLPEDQQREFFDIMSDEQARSMYLNAFVAGALGGGVGGGTVEATKFNKDAENDRLRKIIQARRDAVRIADEQREGTETQDPEPAEQEQSQADFALGQQVIVKATTTETIDGVTRETVTEDPAIIREQVSKRTGKRAVYLEYQGPNDKGKRDYIEIDGENVLNPKIEIISVDQNRSGSVYLGNMPVELQSQLVEDGVDADTATTEQVMASAAKLPEEQRNRVMTAVQSQTDIQSARRQRMKATKVPSTDQVQGDSFLVSTPQTVAEKVEEMNARADGGQTVGGTANLTKIIGKVRKPVKIMGKDGNELELESLREVAKNKSFDDKPEVEEMVSAVLDVVDRGMPMEHVKLIQGTYLFNEDADIPNDVAAGYLPNSRTIGVKLDNLRAGATDEAQARRNRFAIAHEIWHAVDAKNEYSSAIPDFALDVQVDESMNTLLDEDAMDIEAGPALLELMNNWDQGTELGKYFAYPLNTLFDDIRDASPESRPEVVRTAQKEMFAQLGAALIANETLLEQQAPTAYNLIKELRDNPNIAAGEITSANVQAEESPTIADATEVRGDVRTPPVEGSPEVQDAGGAGSDSAVSVEAEQASPELAPAPQPEAGDTAGQLLRAEQYIAANPNTQPSGVQRDLRIGYNKTRELIDELLSQGRIEEDPANLTLTVKQPEPDAVQEPASEVTVTSRKRGENYKSDGQYDYTLSDGTVYKMGRDPNDRMWHLDPQHFEELGYNVHSPQTQGMGFNEKESIARLLEDHADRPEKPDFIRVPTEYTPPRRQKSGKYIGAPRGINTPDKLRRLRQAVKEIAKKGEYGRFWYERSGKNILEITGGNKEDARKLVAAIAITSPQTGVDTNFEFAVQAYYQWKNGEPIESGIFPTSMGKKMEDVFNSDKSFSGRKTSNFENNLLRVIDDDLEQGVTTDIWMMRAFGYPSDNPTDLNYDFVENETLRIANELGWEPQQVQAAIWVEIKARMESKPLKKAVDALSQQKGYFKFVSDSKGKKIRQFKDLASEQAHGQLWVKKALAYEPTEAERESAKFDYKDAALNKLAQISVESIPSTKSGHLPEIFDATEGEIIEFHHEMDKAFLDDDGYDIVARELGMLQMGVSVGLGSWEGRNDPVSQNEVVVPRQYRVKEDGVISKDAEDLIHAYAAVKGILLKQDAIGYHRPFFKDSNTRASQNGVDVDIGRPFSKRETQEISQLLSEYGIEPISTSTGVRFINFSDDDGNPFSGLANYARKKSEMDFEKAINNALTQIEFDNGEGVVASRFVSDNGLIENDWTENTNGEGYLENRLSGRPDLQGRVKDLVTQLQPRVRQVEDEFSERYGWTQNRDLNRVYDEQPDTQPEVETPDYIRTPREDVSFNLNDEFIVDKNIEQKVKSVIGDTTRQKLADRLEGLTRLEERMAASLGLERLPSAISARDAENLMHSKVQKQLEDFEAKYVQTIAEEVKAGDFDLDQVGLYLLAKHAPERNAVIAEKERDLREQQKQSLRDRIAKNTEQGIGSEKFQEQLAILEEAPLKFQETGSGMTDAEAAQILATAKQEGATADLEKIADKVYSMLTDMRENMVEAGLLDDDTRADWEERYQFYVPLKGFAAFPEGMEMKGGNGTAGFSIKGAESFRAKGRTSLPVNPLLVAFKDAEEKIVRAEKNRVAQRLLKLFEKIQSRENWQVFTPAFRPAKSDNPSVMKSDAEMKSEKRADDGMPRYIQVKRLGQTFYIEVKDRELNRQLQTSGVGMFNNSVDFMNSVLTNMQKLQNFRRNMIINYNPSWGLVNPLRDIQTGLAFALSETDSRGGRLQQFDAGELVANVSRGYVDSMTAFWRMRRGTEGKTDVQKEYDQYAAEYVEDGAPTGLSVTKSLEEQQARFKSIIEQGDTKKFLRKAADVVEDYNQTMENAVRLSAYVEARKGGVERADAATLAKDLTVNFNRKGEYSSAIDSLYLFFNAAIQGNVNIMKAMLRPAADGSKFTRARTLATSMVAFGFARTLMNIDMAGEDDDGESKYLDFNEYALKTGMVFMLGEQGMSIPMPYGYGLFDNIGRYAAEYAAGVKTEGEVARDLMLSVDHHFNPQGLHAVENRDLVESAVLRGLFFLGPDTLDLAVEQAANINYFGANITVPSNPFLVRKPASQATKRGTNDVLEGFTEFVNNATGGSEYRSGAVDMSPERIQHIADFFLGGVGRFFSDLSDTVAKLNSEEDDLRSTDVPIIRTFAPIAAEYSDRVDFYDNRSDYRQYQTEYKEASPQEKAALRQRFGADLYQFDVRHKAIEKKLRALSTRKRQLNESETIDLYRRIELLQQIAEEEERMYDEYNKRWNAVKP